MTNDSALPLTVVVSRRVRKGQEAEFEKLSSQMTERTACFPGYLGTAMFRPGGSRIPDCVQIPGSGITDCLGSVQRAGGATGAHREPVGKAERT